jgi:hypothetical protein
VPALSSRRASPPNAYRARHCLAFVLSVWEPLLRERYIDEGEMQVLSETGADLVDDQDVAVLHGYAAAHLCAPTLILPFAFPPSAPLHANLRCVEAALGARVCRACPLAGGRLRSPLRPTARIQWDALVPEELRELLHLLVAGVTVDSEARALKVTMRDLGSGSNALPEAM